ncbi:MAG TPA: hypothetical protein VGB71_08495 [Flavisolibacter sp.]|jgi:hypothetical protein
MADSYPGRNKDMTEESSDLGDEKATRIARQLESDDVNENTGIGTVPTPDGDNAAENKVATSLDND